MSGEKENPIIALYLRYYLSPSETFVYRQLEGVSSRFLPIVLTAYFALRSLAARNALLLAASLVFYTWGELGYVSILLTSIAANYAFGLWITAVQDGTPRSRQYSSIAGCWR